MSSQLPHHHHQQLSSNQQRLRLLQESMKARVFAGKSNLQRVPGPRGGRICIVCGTEKMKNGQCYSCQKARACREKARRDKALAGNEDLAFRKMAEYLRPHRKWREWERRERYVTTFYGIRTSWPRILEAAKYVCVSAATSRG